ncbi:MAG: GNAT family N-acetyltransferase [Acidobacteriota bacterium]|nr:GNAT family N-acetyltransferase [Acidobacteriota bacterium]
MPDVKLAQSAVEIERCFAVMSHLRPSLKQHEFAVRVKAQQAEGYTLAYLEHGGSVVAVAGFRIQRMLSSGKTLYVDDLVTDALHRSHGHGRAMLDWLKEHARSHECETFSLDSGTHRHEAHAFYFREHMRITALHFQTTL